MKFENYWKEIAKLVDSEIYRLVQDEEDEQIKSILSYSLIGGKHFRPTLTVLVSDILGGDREVALKWSLIPELIHTASLLHDDIIDGDLMRRGKPSLHIAILEIVKIILRRKAIPVAILTGDATLAKTFQLLSRLTEVEEHYGAFSDVSSTLYYMLRGVLHEPIMNRSPEDYYMTIRFKTGKLFGLSCKMGEYAAKNVTGKFEEIGEELGVLYQLIDDFADQELPGFVSEDEIREQYDKVMGLIDNISGNEKYIKLFKEVPLFMCKKLAGEQGVEIERILGNYES